MQVIVLLCSALAACRANQFAPHVAKPGNFEGWYSRISSPEGSFGLIFGAYAPNPSYTQPLALVSLIMLPREAKQLTSIDAFPDINSIRVTTNSANVTADPGDKEDAVFKWEAQGMGQFECDGQTQIANFTLPGGASITAAFSSPMPWGPKGEGPEGWVHRLPLFGLEWFVFSLRSNVVFSLKDPASGLQLEGVRGTAHMEKNWGTSFPDAWMWAQGENSTAATCLAVAGGPTAVGPLPVTAFLLGFRSPKVGAWSFHPQDPAVFSTTHDGCAGTWEINATTLTRKLVVRIHTPGSRASFAPVQCPTKLGFAATSEESYSAVATVSAYSGIQHNQLLETQVIHGVALEFGGDFKCSR